VTPAMLTSRIRGRWRTGATELIPVFAAFISGFPAFVQKTPINGALGQQWCNVKIQLPNMDVAVGAVLTFPIFRRLSLLWHSTRQAIVEHAWVRIATIAAAALLLSTRILFQPDLLEYWSIPEVLKAVFNDAFQAFIIGLFLITGVTLASRFRPKRKYLRALTYPGFLIGGSLIGNLTVGFWLSIGWSYPSAAQILGGTFDWASIAGYLWWIDALNTRAFQQKAAARQIEIEKVKTTRQLAATRLQVLEAQIEPHFLFNTLANVKRVFRVDPAKGDEALVNLMVYLQSALPQMRRPTALIDEELDLVRAYLELFSMRMGSRLQFVIQRDPTLLGCSMPTMMLITLVENAIKHGLVPSQNGGTIRILARRDGNTAFVSVADDGVGLGGASTSGSGIGLANIQARLRGVYQDAAQLTVEGQDTGGVRATLCFPVSARQTDQRQAA
jgi:signal transduction histidine kinase